MNQSAEVLLTATQIVDSQDLENHAVEISDALNKLRRMLDKRHVDTSVLPPHQLLLACIDAVANSRLEPDFASEDMLTERDLDDQAEVG